MITTLRSVAMNKITQISWIKILCVSILTNFVRSQWNYNPNSPIGPYHWENAGGGDLMFQEIMETNVNLCERGLAQSPVNLVQSSKCVDDHKIHYKRGSYNWDQIRFQIEPHALRVKFPKANEFDNKTPPGANFSKLSSFFIPAVYMDVKIPSEHYKHGTQYPGEIHIGHKYGNRNVIIGFFIEPTQHNYHLQFEQFLREWEELKWENDYYCEHRHLQYPPPPYLRTYPILSKDEMQRIWGFYHKFRSDFNLYRLIPSKEYFGYDGSITMPPCASRAVWRFLDKPMKISYLQYERLQTVLLDQKNSNCQSSSNSFQGRVNRPLQSNNNHIFRCTKNDFK